MSKKDDHLSFAWGRFGAICTWYCPECGERNWDYPTTTVVLCSECGEGFNWWEIKEADEENDE